MFNSFRILNNRKITILGCDNDLKPTYYAGNSFIITECDKHYNLQMLSDINLRCKIFNKQKINFLVVSIPADENYYKVMNECINENKNYKVISHVELTINTNECRNIGKCSVGNIEFSIVRKDYEIFITHPYFKINIQKLKEII